MARSHLVVALGIGHSLSCGIVGMTFRQSVKAPLARFLTQSLRRPLHHRPTGRNDHR